MSPEIDVEAIGPGFVATVRPDVASVDVDGEVVLYDDGARVFHRLNPSASVLWACLDGASTLSEIAADLAEAYRVAPARVLDDVVSAARRFGAAGLLVGVRRDVEESLVPIPEAPAPDAGAAPATSAGAAPATDASAGADDGSGTGPFVAEPPSP